MSWLESFDTASTRWPAVVRLAYRSVKWSLIALGAWAWAALWYERSPLLGIVQGVLIVSALLAYLFPKLRGGGED